MVNGDYIEAAFSIYGQIQNPPRNFWSQLCPQTSRSARSTPPKSASAKGHMAEGTWRFCEKDGKRWKNNVC